MQNEKVIEKIKKLLVRTEANGCTASEAATAAAQVAILLAKNNLTMADINAEDMELVRETFVKDTKSCSVYQSIIAKALEQHFGVVCYISKRGQLSKLAVFGEKIKVEAFKMTFEFIYKAYKRCWSSYHKSLDISTTEKNQMRLSYLTGFVDGVTNEIIKEENANAIVPVKSDAVVDFESTLSCSHHFSNKSCYSELANSQGYQDGSYTQRNRHKVI